MQDIYLILFLLLLKCIAYKKMKQKKQEKKMNIKSSGFLSSKQKNMSDNIEKSLNINSSNITAFLGDLTAHSSCVGSVIKKDADCGMQFYNPETCLLSLYRALFFLKSLKPKTQEGKNRFFKGKFNRKLKVLFLNTNPEFSTLVKKNAQYCLQDYINTKWVGGTLNNWRQISKSIQAFQFFQWKWKSVLEQKTFLFPRLEKLRKCFSGFQSAYKKLKQKKVKKTIKPSLFLTVGDLFRIPKCQNQYLKRDELVKLSELQKNLNSYSNCLPGLNYPQVNGCYGDKEEPTNLEEQKKLLDKKAQKQNQLRKKPRRFFSMITRKPDLIVVIDPYFHKIAIHEAQLENIPIIGFVNSDSNIKQITYPIFGNNQSHLFVHFCLNWIARMIKNVNMNSTIAKTQV